MSSTVFEDLYILSKKLSPYLPLGFGIPLDTEVTTNTQDYIPEGEHWVVASMTGCGKTTLDKHLVLAHLKKYPYMNVYIFDPKKLDFNKGWGTVYNTFEPPPPIRGIGGKQVWQPVDDDLGMYDLYFRQILGQGRPCIVLIDESKNLKFGTQVPKGYQLLLSQGRGYGIHTITNIQEIAESPRQALSQPTHIVGFKMWNPYDERTLKRILRLPSDEPLPSKGKYSFNYLNVNKAGMPTTYANYSNFIDDFMQWR